MLRQAQGKRRERGGATEPSYPKGKRERPPIGTEGILRMYVAQQCFSLPEDGMEDAGCYSLAIPGCVGMHLRRTACSPSRTCTVRRRGLPQE